MITLETLTSISFNENAILNESKYIYTINCQNDCKSA